MRLNTEFTSGFMYSANVLSREGGMLATVDAQTAARLPEKTERLAVRGREHEYVITLDVFHQIHCLDVVRMALYRDRYDKHFYLPNGTVDYCKWLHVGTQQYHVPAQGTPGGLAAGSADASTDHCIDQLRQALICHADTSVVYYSWSDIVEGVRPRVDNKHTCRNYNKILEWAKSRRVEAKDWHPSRRVVEEQDGTLRIQQGRNHAVAGEGECNGI